MVSIRNIFLSTTNATNAIGPVKSICQRHNFLQTRALLKFNTEFSPFSIRIKEKISIFFHLTAYEQLNIEYLYKRGDEESHSQGSWPGVISYETIRTPIFLIKQNWMKPTWNSLSQEVFKVFFRTLNFFSFQVEFLELGAIQSKFKSIQSKFSNVVYWCQII